MDHDDSSSYAYGSQSQLSDYSDSLSTLGKPIDCSEGPEINEVRLYGSQSQLSDYSDSLSTLGKPIDCSEGPEINEVRLYGSQSQLSDYSDSLSTLANLSTAQKVQRLTR